jgi:hypothetical protein
MRVRWFATKEHVPTLSRFRSSSDSLNAAFSKKGKVVPVLNKLSTTQWRRMGSGCIDVRFLDLDTSWMWVVSFKPLPFYPCGKDPLIPIGYKTGWAPEPVWRICRSKILYLTRTSYESRFDRYSSVLFYWNGMVYIWVKVTEMEEGRGRE